MKKILYLPVLIVLFLFMHPNISIGAAVTLPWSTTYDCASEWTQSDGLYPGCDDLELYGNWIADNGGEEQIRVVANYPGGGGGMGQIHMKGDSYDSNSGSLKVTFATPQSELWIRWYMKYEYDFHWDVLYYEKFLYLKPSSIVPGIVSQHLNLHTGGQTDHRTSIDWNDMMVAGNLDTWVGSSDPTAAVYRKGDDLWHCYEIHVKGDTNGSNGIAEFWFDGVNVLSDFNANLESSTHSPTEYFLIGSNNNLTNNGGDAAVYYDDIAVSNTGYIGPIAGGPDTTAPIVLTGSPTGTLASGTTQTTLSVTTNENATCGYSTSSGTAYASMTPFTTTGGVTGHSETITGLSDGSTYNYYVRCEDSLYNTNTNDYTITFDVASPGSGDTTPPVISGGSPTGTLASGTTQTTLSVTTDENATCGYSTSSGTVYASMTQFTTTGGVTGHSETITGLSDGNTYSYYIRCEDPIPNTNTNDYTITFNVSSGGGSPTTMTFYPTSADGYVGSSGASFTSAHNAAVGTVVDSASVNSRVEVTSSNEINRAFFSFDTSALPDDAVITDAKLNLYVFQTNNNDDDGDDWINVVQGSQSSPTALITDDFDQAGAINNPVEGAARVDITNITAGQYTAWTLDATGLSWISVTGHTMLALREGHDAIDSPPLSYNRIKFYTSEQTGTTEDPYLIITYAPGNPAPAAPTGLTIQ